MTERGMVIVGAGESGAKAAIELRNKGWSGLITIIGEEKLAPYERPPLSKQLLTMKEEPKPVFINQEIAEQYNIRLLTGKKAGRIDRNTHTIKLDDGSSVSYERLLLATGARPRIMSLNDSDLSKMLYLRTFADTLALRKGLLLGTKVAVIGGGFIGLEVAASAVDRGCSVTVVEAAPRILMRGVPEGIARLVEARHLAAGVAMKVGMGIDRIHMEGDQHVILFADGTKLLCDSIVVGIGAIPETALASESGLDIENGIKADERLSTSDSDIFAAGDCCSFPHSLYDGRRIRLEAWRNAQEQGMHAAGSMLGGTDSYSVIPWFWSDQYEQTLQVVGLPDAGEVTVSRDLGEAGQLFFHLNKEGRMIAASGFGPSAGIAKEIRIAEMLIERGATPVLEQLAQPNVRLKTFLSA
ncbi:NAD(P)/FAD-dependent oxidoreductase [Cohnella sp.]|uniref:NAD(P)/FAD-dependent oxidoreductase n=1 Tax=Cohnella sp. TaxID=1883426 RepID=UPI003569650A